MECLGTVTAGMRGTDNSRGYRKIIWTILRRVRKYAMTERPRLYTSVLQDHLATNRQMAFFSGPRQVGKTTPAKRHRIIN
jgi:hypothetical protein